MAKRILRRNGIADFESLILAENEIFVNINSQGHITRVVLRAMAQNEWTLTRYYFNFLKGKAVREFYEVPPGDLSEMATVLEGESDLLNPELVSRGGKSYPSRNLFERFGDFFDLHSTFPYSRLYLRYYKPLGYFGVIRINRIGENSFNFRSNPVVIIDNGGIIQGFNQCFKNHLPDKDAPDLKLGDRGDAWLAPDPLKSLAGTEGDYSPLLDERWEKRFNLDFAEADASRVSEYFAPQDLRRTREGWTWQPLRRRLTLLPMRKPLDTFQFDFRLDLRYEATEGEPPSVILNGVRDNGSFFPDFNGYLLGPHFALPYWQVKKESDIVHWLPRAAEPSGREHTLTAIKRGSAVSLYMDGRFAVGLLDPEPNLDHESFFYLLRRDEKPIVLRSLSLSTLPAAPNLHDGFNEVSFRKSGKGAFLFKPLIHLLKPYGEKLYYPLALYDISMLKENIRLLQASQARIARERDRYKALALGPEFETEAFIGESPAVVSIKREAQKAAAASVTVLLEGETGTGKEVLGHFIHAASDRAKGPFIKVDCSALPETLMESELFGAEKGAFTGATETRKGKLEAAASGTLFLDELANLNLATQAKLLNFLQDFTVTRLGSTRAIRVDARLIGATNRPLKEMVEQGLFRADLYYRLCAVRFRLPPLRERREDVPLLCRHFLQAYNEKLGRSIKGFSQAALLKLQAHDWPGNVRELENVVQKAVLFCEKDVIDREQIDMSPAAAGSGPSPVSQPAVKEEGIPRGRSRALTREHVEELLWRSNNVVAWAAREAAVSTVTMFRKIRKFGITVRR
jgi:DNA-binding NtrC family response regulator